jgi:hypothetical protein
MYRGDAANTNGGDRQRSTLQQRATIASGPRPW